jgi:L-threonylcarbamoyladenylate synthase
MQMGQDINQASAYLQAGDCIGLPTETVYGLAGNALDATVVARIFAIKNRPAFDPLIVHGADAATLFALADSIPPQAQALADAFWPGPLTLLLPTSPRVPDLVTAGSPYVAVRVPAHPLALALLRQLSFPLAAPSANPFGYVSPTTAQHVADQLGAQIPYVLDGGPCTVGIESTVVGFPNGRPAIYRRGGIPLEALEAVVGPVDQAPPNPLAPEAPGMLARHYAPRTPLLLGHISTLLAAQPQPDHVAILSFQNRYRDGQPQDIVLAPDGKTETAARHLFAAMRLLDDPQWVAILAEPAPNEGLGAAINDRLRKAAATTTHSHD